jgi:hypothetical protein
METKKGSVCGMSFEEKNKFLLALDSAGFNEEIIREIIKSKDNKFAKDMYTAVGVHFQFVGYSGCNATMGLGIVT